MNLLQINRVVSNYIIGLLLFLVCGATHAQLETAIKTNTTALATEPQSLVYWNVKAFRPQATFMDIKAIDRNGEMFEVKAIQTSDDSSVLNVKALVHGQELPIKLIIKKDDRYYPVKAIDNEGYLINIKAINEKGEILDVKGVSKSGNIVHLRAIDKTLSLYNIIAVSPEGKVNDVKGIKMLDTEIETVIKGIPIFAHVKSISQQ